MMLSICMRVGYFACTIAITIWAPIAQSDTSTSQNEAVQQFASHVARTLATNPGMQAAQASVDAASAQLSGAALPLNNPELEAEAETTDVDTYALGISQTIDWHDKRSAYEQVAQAELAAVEMQLNALRLDKASELLDTIGALTTRQKVVFFSERRTKVLERSKKLAKQRYSAGDIPLTDLQLSRLLLSEAMMQHARNVADLNQAKSDYFSISGQPAEEEFELPDQLPIALPSALGHIALAQNHPSVKAALQAAQAARQQINATDRERKADPSFGLAAGREGKDNLIRLSFSIPLQFRNNYQSNVDTAQAKALQADQEAQQTYRNLLARLNGAQESYKLIAQAWGLWKSQGRSSLQQRISLLEQLWKAGEMDTTDYLIQVQQTLDTQIAGVELHGELWSAWIEWLSASGTLGIWLNQDHMEQ